MSEAPSPTAGELKQLYRDTIMRHARHPVGYNRPISATHTNEQFNPLCGDRVILQLEISGDTVNDAAFEGDSCAICKASASMLCELAPGATTGSITATGRRLESAMAEGAESELEAELHALLGVRDYPSRIDCALLPWKALQELF